MKTDLFGSCGHCWVFQICWHIECSTLTASSFRIWNSSTGILSPPLALFVEKAMAPHSTTLAWKIPWMEEPGRLQSTESLRVRHDWATSLWLFTFMRWRRNGNPLQCSYLENLRDRGAWWAAVYRVTQDPGQPTSTLYSILISRGFYVCWTRAKLQIVNHRLLLLLLSRFSRVRLCATPWTAAYQDTPSMGL